MVDGMKELEGVIELSYRWSLGTVWSRFFDGLREGRILGTRCRKCGRVLVPARRHCPRCFVETPEWVEVKDEGTVTTFTVTYLSYPGEPRKPPYAVAFIRLDGSDTDFIHFLEGVDISDPEKVRRMESRIVGARVQAVWLPAEERKGNIMDLRGFRPITPLE